MTQKLLFKKYRKIVEQFGVPLSFTRKITPKQKLLLQRSSQLSRKRKKLSYFGQKLQCKRLFSFLYGNLSRKQFYVLLGQASNLQGSLSSNFISLLEKRLDIVVYRMFHFHNLSAVRQYIRHQGILVNNTLTTLSNYQLKPGDIIRLTDIESALNYTKLDTKGTQGSLPSKFLSEGPVSLVGRLGSLRASPVGKHRRPKVQGEEDRRSQTSFETSGFSPGSLKHFRMKFPHLEVNYKLCAGIFLFSPKQVFYPIQIRKEDFIPKDYK